MDNDSHHDTHQDSHDRNGGYRRIELISGTPRRRRWSDDERARILSESFEPGANVSAVARRNGVSCGLLHNWRKQARAMAGETVSVDLPTFVPVSVAGATGSREVEVPRAQTAGVIEIEMAGALVRVPAAVDPRTLKIVLAALRRAS